jgi:hypothetical protein
VFCASAGLYALGATSVCYLVGAGCAGAISSHCHRCARVARGRSSRLAPRCALASSPSLWRPVAAGHDSRLLRARTSVVCVAGCGCFDYVDFVDFVDLATGAWSPGATVAASAASAVCATIAALCGSRCRDVNNLAANLDGQGKLKKAEVLYRRFLEGNEKALGAEHADTLTSVNNLAINLHKQGRLEEAEALLRRALEGREKALGAEHAETLCSVNNLATNLGKQGRLEEEETLSSSSLTPRPRTTTRLPALAHTPAVVPCSAGINGRGRWSTSTPRSRNGSLLECRTRRGRSSLSVSLGS